MSDFDERRALADQSHQNALARQREGREDRARLETRKEASKTNTALIAQTGNLEAMRLSHDLDAETRERDFLDLVREENVRLQSLMQETKIRQIDRTHKSQTQLNQMAQEAIIDTVKKLLQKQLGLTEQDLNAGYFRATERAKLELEREFKDLSAQDIAAIMAALRSE